MKTFLCLAALLLGSYCFSQISPQEEARLEKEFEGILNLQFSKIITGNSFSNFGNFATVSSDQKSLTASVNVIQNRRSILNITASGGATNGISEFFDEGELNSNVGINLSFHWISPFHDIRVGRDVAIRKKFDAEEKKITAQYKEDSIAALTFKKLTFAKVNLEKSKKKLFRQNTARQAIQKTIHPIKHDSLSYEIEKTKLEIQDLEKQISKLQQQKDDIESLPDLTGQERSDILLEDSRQQRDLALKTLDDKRRNSEIDEIKLSWFSFGYGVRNDAFKLFDASQPFGEQIDNTSYTSHNANIAYSHYDWASASLFDLYYSIGLNFNYSSNLNTLASLEISDIRTTSTDPLREAVSTQNVFEGDYQEDIKELIPFIDFYLFYGTRRTIALHLNPMVVYKDDLKPSASMKFGLLIPFQKADKQTSTVNLEVFYRLNDIFDTLDSDKSLLGRNTIGLQASFPITFL